MKAIVSEKEQVTIPKSVRDKLGLTPGAVLEFEVACGRLMARKVLVEDTLSKWRGRGRLPGSMSVDDYLQLARDTEESVDA